MIRKSPVSLRILQLFVLFLMIAMLSCNKDDDDNAKPGYSLNDANKLVVQTVTTNLATGINTIFLNSMNDSLQLIEFCRSFTHNAKFFTDESGYIFVESLDGINIAHPAKPELEGTPTLDQTDAYGKLIVLGMINLAKYTGHGFYEYSWENPISNEIETKSTFVKAIPAASWYAGSGFFRTDDETLLTGQAVNEMVVSNAVKSMAGGLGAALDTYAGDSLDKVNFMRDFLQHIRFFDNQSGYFYVIDFTGYNVVQPPDPSIQGTDEWDIQDSQGTFLVQGLISTAQSGGGFYEYYWQNYQSEKEELKKAFVMQIPGTNYLIGSGTYMESSENEDDD